MRRFPTRGFSQESRNCCNLARDLGDRNCHAQGFAHQSVHNQELIKIAPGLTKEAGRDLCFIRGLQGWTGVVPWPRTRGKRVTPVTAREPTETSLSSSASSVSRRKS